MKSADSQLDQNNKKIIIEIKNFDDDLTSKIDLLFRTVSKQFLKDEALPRDISVEFISFSLNYQIIDIIDYLSELLKTKLNYNEIFIKPKKISTNKPKNTININSEIARISFLNIISSATKNAFRAYDFFSDIKGDKIYLRRMIKNISKNIANLNKVNIDEKTEIALRFFMENEEIFSCELLLKFDSEERKNEFYKKNHFSDIRFLQKIPENIIGIEVTNSFFSILDLNEVQKDKIYYEKIKKYQGIVCLIILSQLVNITNISFHLIETSDPEYNSFFYQNNSVQHKPILAPDFLKIFFNSLNLNFPFIFDPENTPITSIIKWLNSPTAEIENDDIPKEFKDFICSIRDQLTIIDQRLENSDRNHFPCHLIKDVALYIAPEWSNSLTSRLYIRFEDSETYQKIYAQLKNFKIPNLIFSLNSHPIISTVMDVSTICSTEQDNALNGILGLYTLYKLLKIIPAQLLLSSEECDLFIYNGKNYLAGLFNFFKFITLNTTTNTNEFSKFSLEFTNNTYCNNAFNLISQTNLFNIKKDDTTHSIYIYSLSYCDEKNKNQRDEEKILELFLIKFYINSLMKPIEKYCSIEDLKAIKIKYDDEISSVEFKFNQEKNCTCFFSRKYNNNQIQHGSTTIWEKPKLTDNNSHPYIKEVHSFLKYFDTNLKKTYKKFGNRDLPWEPNIKKFLLPQDCKLTLSVNFFEPDTIPRKDNNSAFQLDHIELRFTSETKKINKLYQAINSANLSIKAIQYSFDSLKLRIELDESGKNKHAINRSTYYNDIAFAALYHLMTYFSISDINTDYKLQGYYSSMKCFKNLRFTIPQQYKAFFDGTSFNGTYNISGKNVFPSGDDSYSFVMKP